MITVLGWIGVVVVVGLAISLPVILVTGLLGGHPLGGTLAFAGLMGLVLGVVWYVRTHRGVP